MVTGCPILLYSVKVRKVWKSNYNIPRRLIPSWTTTCVQLFEENLAWAANWVWGKRQTEEEHTAFKQDRTVLEPEFFFALGLWMCLHEASTCLLQNKHWSRILSQQVQNPWQKSAASGLPCPLPKVRDRQWLREGSASGVMQTDYDWIISAYPYY